MLQVMTRERMYKSRKNYLYLTTEMPHSKRGLYIYRMYTNTLLYGRMDRQLGKIIFHQVFSVFFFLCK